jgi:stage IV sporulation protein FB
MSDVEISEVPVQDESVNQFPPKPRFGESPPNLQGSMISLILFVGLFLLLGMELRLIFIILFVLIIHELGHFTAMKQFGYKNVNMFFVPLFGAFVSGEKDEASEGQSVATILAGPVPGIFIGLVFLYLEHVVGLPQLKTLPEVFLSLNILNLLPILPLDGGRLIEVMFTKGKAYLELVFLSLSIVMIALLAWALQSLPALIIAVFIFLQVRKNLKNQKMRKWMTQAGLNLRASYEQLTDAEFWRMDAVLRMQMPGGNELPPAVTAILVRNLLQPEPERKLSWVSRIAILLFWIACLLIPVFLFVWLKFGSLQGINAGISV